MREIKRITSICKFCERTFEAKIYRNAPNVFCSKKCARDSSNAKFRELKREANNRKYADVADIPMCKICGWKSQALHSHIKGAHKMTVDQYKEQYGASNSDVYHSSYLNMLSEKNSGENNPGFQHGGKFSSFSEKFIKYKDLPISKKREKINEQIIKANKTKDENCSYNVRADFYVKRGFSKEGAEQQVRDRQRTFSLQKCIEQLGEEAGMQRWKDRQDKWIETLSNLPNDVKERIKNARFEVEPYQVSNISKELFSNLGPVYENSYYGNHEKNLILETELGDVKYIRPDFLWKNKIIEFYGDYWHGNPDKYEDDDIICMGMVCKDVREKDIKRNELLKKNGYDILIIWESEYKLDTLGVLQRCRDFLNI